MHAEKTSQGLLSRGQLDQLQRARILDAVAKVVARRGYATVTIADVVAESGISRRTFYELFDNKAEAFFATYDALVDRAIRRMRVACRGESAVEGSVLVALATLVGLAERHPAWARLCVFEAPAASLAIGDRARHLRPMTTWVADVHRHLRLDLGLDPVEHAGMVLGGLQAAMVAGTADRAALTRGFYRLTIGRDPPSLELPAVVDGEPDRAAAIVGALGSPVAVDRARAHVVDAIADHDACSLAAAEAAIDRALSLPDAPRVELLLLRHVVRAGGHGGPGGVLAAIGFARSGDATRASALRCLYQLVDRPGLSGRELAEAIGLREAAVSRLLGQLSERGVVESRPAGARKRWTVTDAGRAVLALPGRGVESEALAGLGDA